MHFILLIIRLCICLKNRVTFIWYFNNSHVVVGLRPYEYLLGIQAITVTVLVITAS